MAGPRPEADGDYTMCEKRSFFHGDQRTHRDSPYEWKEGKILQEFLPRITSTNQYEKDMAVYAVRDAVGRLENIQKLAAP